MPAKLVCYHRGLGFPEAKRKSNTISFALVIGNSITVKLQMETNNCERKYSQPIILTLYWLAIHATRESKKKKREGKHAD